MASLIAKIYNDKIEKCSYEETVLHIFDLIFSWKIGGKIKHIIKRAVKNVFNHFKCNNMVIFRIIYFFRGNLLLTTWIYGQLQDWGDNWANYFYTIIPTFILIEFLYIQYQLSLKLYRLTICYNNFNIMSFSWESWR